MSEENTEIFYQSYSKAGFHFPTSTLTTYALSLSTKPFVILSGISGTGKTKIAQLFDVPQVTPNKEDANKIIPKLSFKIQKDFGRFNFHHSLLSELLMDADLDEFNQHAEEYTAREDDGNFTETYILTINDEFGAFQIGIYGQRAKSPLVRARYYKSNRDPGPDYDAREHIKNHYQEGDVLKLERVGDKLFSVVSVNDQEITREINDYEFETLERTRFIPVRSDWTDNSELFGFYNLIEKKYHVPSFLDFLLTARNNPDYPFFIILDEMNLSKVEHYFSDILSCMESRIQTETSIKQEKVILHSGLEELETDSETYESIPSAIEIPLNLYITGTVNIDESTYMFSPKVLDRANVIEFNEVDLVTYGNNEHEDDDSYKLKTFPDFTNLILATKEAYETLPDNIKKHLIELNNILKEYNLHFGYRTANEVALYIHKATEFIGDTDEIRIEALDYQLIQKILPKLNGGYAALEPALQNILLYLAEADNLSTINPEQTMFPKTISKLQRMYKKLSTNGFASFID